jgi:DNA-binding transcriptional LysR family regulator
MKNTSWDAYQIFLSVARCGGLTGATAETGLSAATIGRHMLELERELGRELFVRSQTGYRLTNDGRQLFEHLADFEAAARKVERWRQETVGDALVRLALGTWIAWLVSENIRAIVTEADPFRLDIFIAEHRAALSHREADIGLRAFEPEESNLAKVQIGEVKYAAYRTKNAGGDRQERYVAVAKEDAISAYLRWPHEHKPEEIVITVNRPRSLKDLALAGAGIAVLPCFVGELEPGLERAGGEIDALTHGQWLVMNAEDRHRREIRIVADRLIKLLKAHARRNSSRNR